MSDENKNHEPVLLSKDHRKEKIKPPYLLIALMLFGVLSAFWKMAVRKDEPPKPVENPPAKIRIAPH